MPDISVSDNLYRRLEDATDGQDTEEAMWRMLHLFERTNNPSE